MGRKGTVARILFLWGCLLLGSCGVADTGGPQSGSATPATDTLALAPAPAAPVITNDIAKLLRKRPAPGEQVELDVYNWVGTRRQASYDIDINHCPILHTMSLLTDQPVVGGFNFFNTGRTNWEGRYPPDSDPWLVPMFAAQKIMAYPPPDEQAANMQYLGYRLRVRGHLDDPYFGQCAQAARIFVIDKVVTIYTMNDPNALSPFDSVLPSDFPTWQRYTASSQRLHFPRRAGWAVAPVADAKARATLEVRMPEWQQHPITIRVLDSLNGSTPVGAGQDNGQFDVAFLRQRLGLPDNDQQFTGEVYIGSVDLYTNTCTAVLNRGDASYVFQVSYPVGLHADRDLLLAFNALVAGFEVD